MAQYSNDFSQYTIGQPPAGWTAWASGALSDIAVNESGGEYYLTFLGADSNARRFYTWDAVPATSGDVEVYFEFLMPFTTLGQDARAVLRLDPATNTNNDDENAILTGARPSEGAVFTSVYEGGVTNGGGTAPYTFSENVRYCVLASLVGSNLSTTVWVKGEAQPSPQYTETIVPDFPAGLTGLGYFTKSGTDRIFFIGAGTEGDPAPRAMLSGPTVSLGVSEYGPGATINFTYSGFDGDPTAGPVSITSGGVTHSTDDASPFLTNLTWGTDTVDDDNKHSGSGSVDLGPMPTDGNSVKGLPFSDSAELTILDPGA